MVNLTIYSKNDCHLCDVAKEILLKVQKESPFSLTEIDIEKDSTAFERYRYLIPVVEIDGKIAFIYRVDENELIELLRQAQPQ